jgi:hypothetical protein
MARPLTTTDLVVQYYPITLPGWSGKPVKIVHLSDFHVSRLLPMGYFQQVVERASAEKPDLVFITGDFITFEQDAALLPRALRGLHARLGIFGVLGNHDHAKAAAAVLREAASLGIHMIGGQVLRVPGQPELVLAGDEQPWGAEAPLSTWADQPGDHLLILTHTPDNIYRLTESRVAPAGVFAGHLHAGQLRLPYFGAIIVPSRYGRLFAHGHYQVNGSHLFVSAGIGAVTPPIRIWCRPEIVVVEISGGQTDKASTIAS